MGKAILITSLLLSIVIAMASSLDSPMSFDSELKELHSPKELPVPRTPRNVQGDGRQPELEVYLLKRSSSRNWGLGTENKPVVQSNTDNVDCQCKCGRKKNDGSTGLFSDDGLLAYSDHPGLARGKIINVPPNCPPDQHWDGSHCRVVF